MHTCMKQLIILNRVKIGYHPSSFSRHPLPAMLPLDDAPAMQTGAGT